MSYLAEVAFAVGEPTSARLLYDLLSPFDGRNVGLWDIASNGAVAHYLGILAVRQDDLDTAEHHLRDAVSFNQRTGQLPSAAWSRLRLAQVLGDQKKPIEALDLARQTRKYAEDRNFAALLRASEQVIVDTSTPHPAAPGV